MKKYEFDVQIKKHERINAGYIDFPFDVEKEFSKRGQVKVKAWIEGQFYQGSLVRMGGEHHWLGITQEMRKLTGKNPGDMVHIIIEQETEERIVNIPSDFEELMKSEPGVSEYFAGLSYTHRKEYVRWIEEAKKVETRMSRLRNAIDMLKGKKKDHR